MSTVKNRITVRLADHDMRDLQEVALYEGIELAHLARVVIGRWLASNQLVVNKARRYADHAHTLRSSIATEEPPDDLEEIPF